MKNKFVVTVMLLVLFLTVTSTVLAKRAAPKGVEPVRAGHIEYRAPTSTFAEDPKGYVQAWDISKNNKRGRLLWQRQIYVIKYDMDLERDVQDVFITSLELKDNTLLIKNENDSEYELDLETLEVKVIKGALIEQRKSRRGDDRA